ncbi:MAG TPA: exo-beta-N-acetylmuramidase NamZ domain-containing protein [Candidatus Acidoferrales bacterium]|nr:exo-beta-N-acetylmuramidase NamZ domain-containing protein [Candidatus Acidoferrales bacterium]
MKTRYAKLRLVALAFAAAAAAAGALPAAVPGPPKLADVDAIIDQAIAQDELPGAVLLVGHRGRVVYRKAYGRRALVPRREPMSVDTIFDMASLTKVLATTPSLMLLFQQGKIRLDDPVARYLPEFGANGKDHITIRMLMTHFSGLRPDPLLPPGPTGYDAVLRIIYADAPILPPGMRFLYSDCNYIVLGELVRKVSGMPLDQFAARNVFQPLGMLHTRFLPPPAWRPRIAPTEEIDLPDGAKPGSGRGHVLRGVVHDPTARAMGGVAGHAGLFSTADDLSLFCRMMLASGRIASGRYRGRQLLQPATIHKMTTPQSPPWSPSLRGLGWDIDTAFSSNRGELFPLASYGHTGFTGTSIWIDPASQTYVILLANSVHPYRRPALSSLRSRVATLVAAALGAGDTSGATSLRERGIGAEQRPYDEEGVVTRSDRTLAGIDVLEQENFAPLEGRAVGLITNQTGIDRAGRRTIDVLAHAPGVKLVAIFSPEHGLFGLADTKVGNAKDSATGLPVYSLYGETLRPTDRMLRGIDALVYDIQDAGVRFYTFTTTMAYGMEAAAGRRIAFFVLDRPNPLGGERIEGPLLDSDRLSFVGYFPEPTIYGMTLGELARMFNGENHIGADLTVVPMQNWHRRDLFDATGLTWIPPSPNLRTINETLLYPGIEILQAGGVSVGRGTDTPFELLGAPWIDAGQLGDALNAEHIPGVRFVPTRFTPRDGLYRGQACQGVEMVITDGASLSPMLMGLEIGVTLHRLYPQNFMLEKTIELVGSRATIEQLEAGLPPAAIVVGWQEELDRFRAIRQKYLLYP